MIDPVDALFGIVTVPGGTDSFLAQLRDVGDDAAADCD